MISRNVQNKIVFRLRKFPIIQSVLTKIYHAFFRSFVEAARAKYFLRNSMDVLKDFVTCMDNNQHFYTLAFGSMLGAVREKGFIKHDTDIDVYMWIEDYSESVKNDLESVGFKLAHCFSVEDGLSGQELTFEKNGVWIDIFFIYPAINEYPYCCDFITQEDCQNYEIAMKTYGCVIARRLEMPFIKERIKTKFESIDMYVPKNADELLRFRYGDDYMTPNPNWNIRSFDKHIVVWSDKFGTYVHY